MFFTEDIVERIDKPSLGVVARSWNEQQPDYDATTISPQDPLLRALIKGEIGVQTYPAGNREILSEDLFRLVDRGSFVRGDFCKRSRDDAQSGVVLNVKVEVKIQHAITMQTIDDQWFDKDDFRANQPLLPGDFVFCDNWVGQVEEIFNEALMVNPAAKMQPVYELGGRFAVGEKCYSMPSADGQKGQEQESDLIVKITPIAAAISWSAVNQTLDSATIDESKRPQQFWPVDELHKLSVMRARGSVAGTIGERVVFKDPLRAINLGLNPMIYKDQDMRVDFIVDVMVITLTRTRVEVLWQDGKREWVPSTAIIPHVNLDEYECWPGDHVLWKNEEEQKVAIVQAVSAKDRVATVRWAESGLKDDVSVLELDPHGMTYPGGSPLDAFGLRRGECVLIHRDGTTNGLQVPMVPRIGELEPWVNEVPNRGPDGTMDGWRGELTNLAMKSLGYETSKKERLNPQNPSVQTSDSWVGQVVDVMTGGQPGKFDTPQLSQPTGINWFGQVTDLTLEGDAVVCLPSLEQIIVPLNRCSLYRDVDDYQWADDQALEDFMDVDDPLSETSWEALDLEERNDWSHMEVDDSIDGIHPEDLSNRSQALTKPAFVRKVTMPGSYSPEPPSPPSDYDEVTTHASSSITEVECNSPPPPPALPRTKLISSDEDVRLMLTEQEQSMDSHTTDESDDDHWKHFDILPSAPPDHAFYSVEPPQTSKQFLSRLSKEYRVLESSLPGSILVRAYEDRTDLLRCLIIGPHNTPYQDSPFVIDWRLDGTFPQTPPIAHFLSWTNGNGRVNPNLYEEGKVCLSILGTWAGDRNESWSAARSSLLQAFVSIQGLVLVKEPYFCEPSYEKMRGTQEGQLNSRLYSEKAYVLSRGFVRRALEIPLGGLEEEIAWFYYTKGGLARVLADSEQLIQRSNSPGSNSSEADDEDVAIPRLSAGGVLTLNRTLTKLRSLLEARQATR